LSDLEGHSPIVSLFKRDFCTVVRTAIDKISTNATSRAVPLR